MSFNQLVKLVGTAQAMIHPKSVFLSEFSAIAMAHQVNINNLSLQGFGAPITLSGTAASQDRVVAFETALQSANGFSNVNLPLTAIQMNGSTISFAMTFTFTPPAGS